MKYDTYFWTYEVIWYFTQDLACLRTGHLIITSPYFAPSEGLRLSQSRNHLYVRCQNYFIACSSSEQIRSARHWREMKELFENVLYLNCSTMIEWALSSKKVYDVKMTQNFITLNAKRTVTHNVKKITLFFFLHFMVPMRL